jgi:hypothetical protein
MEIDKNKYMHHLDKVCSDYNMSAFDIHNVLISKNDEDFPLTFETVKYKVLKDVPCNILENIFSAGELKSIFEDINVKKIKNKETKKFINNLKN